MKIQASHRDFTRDEGFDRTAETGERESQTTGMAVFDRDGRICSATPKGAHREIIGEIQTGERRRGARRNPRTAHRTPESASKHCSGFAVVSRELEKQSGSAGIIVSIILGPRAFVARQKRLRVGTEWYRVDLLFFHRRLRAFDRYRAKTAENMRVLWGYVKT
ncbi:MAG TPA: hypothetical protein VG273_27670, partial [Bryobacteraceae bacterium]|nr:hypothetical protein [Bryobacteraceae bacterium]